MIHITIGSGIGWAIFAVVAITILIVLDWQAEHRI